MKFSLLSFIYSVIILLVFVLLLIPNLKLQNITLEKQFEISQFFKFTNIFLPIITVSVFCFSVVGKAEKSAIISGAFIGSGFLLLCAISTILLFGSEFSAQIEYPFLKAASTIAIGKLFSRLDAFVYPIFIFCSLIRVAVCINAIKFCLKKPEKVKK